MYTTDKIFGIKYKEYQGVLEINEKGFIKNLINKMKKHKSMTIVIFSTIVFSVINIILIYQFFSILGKLI